MTETRNEAAARLLGGYEPAVDDFGNQYLARTDRDEICHHCGQKMIVVEIGPAAGFATLDAPANERRATVERIRTRMRAVSIGGLSDGPDLIATTTILRDDLHRILDEEAAR